MSQPTGSDVDKSVAKYKELCSKRSSIKGQITKFKNYLSSLSSIQLTSHELAKLTLKLTKFEGLSTNFDLLQTEIEVINSQNLDHELNERDSIEHNIISCMATAKEAVTAIPTDSYVMHVNPEDFMYMQTQLPEQNTEPATPEPDTTPKPTPKRKMTPAEILERAKQLQKVNCPSRGEPGTKIVRRCKSELPPPHELLASPNFRLFLYSCKYLQLQVQRYQGDVCA
ncbi:hypothetical protein ACJJTC_015372 [Scirpophaga incertulas]